jgi:hypothetical protein
MKYVKLFENFQTNFSAGYILDGGNKSYPCVLDSSMVEKIESMVDSDFTFIVKEELNAFPEALLISYSEDGESSLEGITNEYAQQIISLSNSDIYTNDTSSYTEEGGWAEKSEDEIEKDKQAFDLAGISYYDEYSDAENWNRLDNEDEDEDRASVYRVLCVIPNIRPNTVYESDSQEGTGYWEPPYKAIPLDEYLGDY